MQKYCYSIIVGFVIILLIGQISVVTDVTSHQLDKYIDWPPAVVNGMNFVPDSNFANEAEIVINGTSDEFSSGYHHAANSSDFNYMELTWEHEANTPLDFRSEHDENLPDCNDFIYFYQEFEWPYNQKPADANFTFSYSTTLTGDFANETLLGNLMFRIYVWLIDSSGNWTMIYESREATYTEIYQAKRVSTNYYDIEEVWGGMVSLNGTPQEDPEDIVQIAIGLSPRLFFEYYSETEPWTFFDGTVSFKIKTMELWLYGDFIIASTSSSTSTTTSFNATGSITNADYELPSNLIVVGVLGASIVTIAVVVYVKKFK